MKYNLRNRYRFLPAIDSTLTYLVNPFFMAFFMALSNSHNHFPSPMYGVNEDNGLTYDVKYRRGKHYIDIMTSKEEKTLH